MFLLAEVRQRFRDVRANADWATQSRNLGQNIVPWVFETEAPDKSCWCSFGQHLRVTESTHNSVNRWASSRGL